MRRAAQLWTQRSVWTEEGRRQTGNERIAVVEQRRDRMSGAINFISFTKVVSTRSWEPVCAPPSLYNVFSQDEGLLAVKGEWVVGSASLWSHDTNIKWVTVEPFFSRSAVNSQGQNIASLSSSAARNSAFLSSTFRVHSASFLGGF